MSRRVIQNSRTVGELTNARPVELVALLEYGFRSDVTPLIGLF
jgi:hypothetical protein